MSTASRVMQWQSLLLGLLAILFAGSVQGGVTVGTQTVASTLSFVTDSSSAFVSFLWARLAEYGDWVQQLPGFSTVTSFVVTSRRLLHKGKDISDDMFVFYTFFISTYFIIGVLRRVWSGDLLNEFASDKIVQETTCVISWNIFPRVAAAPSAAPGTPSRASRKGKAAAAAPAGTLAHDIATFKQQVRAGEIKLELVTEGTIPVAEAVTDPALLEKFVRSAKRRLGDKEDFGDDSVEDFLVTFEGAPPQYALSKLYQNASGALYKYPLPIVGCGMVLQFIIPNGELTSALLNNLQILLYLTTCGYMLFIVASIVYSYVLVRYYKYAKWVSEESPRMIPESFRTHLRTAADVIAEKQAMDQQNCMRKLLNHVSEKLASSNWPAHCSRLMREVPDEFWAKSGIQKGRYFLVLTCEKEPSVVMGCTRLWLVNPYDLFLLTQLTRNELDYFQVNDPGRRTAEEANLDRYPYVGHKLRIHHLRQWALLEFETDGRRKSPASRSRLPSLDFVFPSVN